MTICNENEIDHEKWIIQLIDLDVEHNKKTQYNTTTWTQYKI